MRVLQINAVYGYGSTGTIVENLYDLANRLGIDTYVAYQRTNKRIPNGYQIGNILDWKCHAIMTRITGKQGFYSTTATYKFLKWCNSVKPDIIHAHNIHSNYINWPLVCNYCGKKGIPLIITLHDCWFFTGKCTHFVQTRCDHWARGCGGCSQLKREAPSLFFDNTHQVLEKKRECCSKIENLYVVGCSEWISSLARRSILKDKNIRTIRNGIDTEIFNAKERDTVKMMLGLEGRFVVLGFADKWFDTRNRTGVRKILDELHENDVAVIAGCNDTQLEHYKDNKRVVTIPYISDKRQLVQVYKAADVFVNLTHADTLPTVNMESICCGTPVVSFNCGGSPELIDEDDGIVVAENDFEGIIDAVNDVKNGRCVFDPNIKTAKYDKNKCFMNYIDLYREINENTGSYPSNV